jgi:hypothetical protein
MSADSYEAQFRAFRTFLDGLYGVLIGFLIARLHDFRFFSVMEGGWPTLREVLPFVVLYSVYLLKLTLFWLGSRNSLRILSHYVPFAFRGYHYLAAIVSALFLTQVVSSAVCDCGAISSDALPAYSVYFLTWMSLGTLAGDAIPTLTGVLPTVHRLLEKARITHGTKRRAKELEELRLHYDGPIRRNAIINVALVLLSWLLYLVLWRFDVGPVQRTYALVGLLLTLNTIQELLLWNARETQLRAKLDKLEDDA